MNTNSSKFSRFLLIVTALCLVISIFVPLWRIELDAPQYPEGLKLTIHANKLGGQVDIINGLNHYIGMGTLHAENFIEFTVLPYIITFFVLLFLAAAMSAKKKLLYFSFWSFVLFGVIAMVDFWRWEYNYGHNLDPNAAIIVPGMSYQPPLVGFKQLLNFGAFSVPDIGGWLFVIGGMFALIAVLIETGLLAKFTRKKTIVTASLLLACTLGFTSCNTSEAQAIKLNKDKCDFCEMTISDGRFGAEVITKKGRVYKFDDLHCLQGYTRENTKVEIASYFIHDYLQSNVLIDAGSAFYVEDETLNSPMGGNTAAFNSKQAASELSMSNGSEIKLWSELNP